MYSRGLLAFLSEFFLEGCESRDVAESSFLDRSAHYRSLFCNFCFLSCFLSLCLFCTSFIFEDAAVREDDALRVLVEFDNLEVQLLVNLSLSSKLSLTR